RSACRVAQRGNQIGGPEHKRRKLQIAEYGGRRALRQQGGRQHADQENGTEAYFGLCQRQEQPVYGGLKPCFHVVGILVHALLILELRYVIVFLHFDLVFQSFVNSLFPFSIQCPQTI